MTTNEFERDLNDQAGLKRPGRVDLRVFQNTPDAGDGNPGVQRCFRNYLHEGGMEKDLDLVGYSIKGTSVNINNAELQQLTNIGVTTVSAAQWGYVGNMDQEIHKGYSPEFAGLTINGSITITGNVDGVDVSVLKTDFDNHKANNGSDHSYINQDIKTTASPTFVGLTLSANLVTSSTIDGVDVSAIKLNSMPSVADGNIDANTQKIINVVDPVDNQDASTKAYANSLGATGTYTGDGEGTGAGWEGAQAIDVGFRPRIVSVMEDGSGEVIYFTVWDNWSSSNRCYMIPSGITATYRLGITATGFQVSDVGSDAHPNKDGTIYNYIALK